MNQSVLEDALRFDRAAMWRVLGWCAAGYAALSAACYFVQSLPPAVLSTLVRAARLVWLLGPPGLLMHREGVLGIYFVATAILAGTVVAGAESFRRLSAWSIVFAAGAVTLWLTCGLMIYAPTF
jgi:hypothetical protein